MHKIKNVLIGITGSIAAFKIPELVRLFKKEKFNVKIIQTKSSLDFVSPLTLSVLSENKVLSSTITYEKTWNNHVSLSNWADIFIIAPLTANTLAKMANGQCDNLLLATYLSTKCKTYVAPAMDLDMFQHHTTKTNLLTIEKHGVKVIPAKFGELASGLIGDGRMAEPQEIFNITINKSNPKLKGKNVLITAGPTYENIDPVRFIGNRSSGKMGIEIAKICSDFGAKVNLILGPIAKQFEYDNVTTHKIESAKQMYDTAISLYSDSDILIFSAAVSDYSPEKTNDLKLKKKDDFLNIKLKRTKDIILEISKRKNKDQFIVGFALETDNAIKNAKLKLHKKKLDMIILNSLEDKGAGFQKDTNKISIIDKNNNITKYKLKNKSEVAKDIIDNIIKLKYA